MPRICRKKSDGSIVPDFQSKATKDTLITNAVNNGLGLAEDFEELEVDDATFQGHVDDYKALFAADRLAEEQNKADIKASTNAKFAVLGFTVEEIKDIREG